MRGINAGVHFVLLCEEPSSSRIASFMRTRFKTATAGSANGRRTNRCRPTAATPVRPPSMPRSNRQRLYDLSWRSIRPSALFNTLAGLLGRPASGAHHYHEIEWSEIRDGLGFFIRATFATQRRPETDDRSLDGDPKNR